MLRRWLVAEEALPGQTFDCAAFAHDPETRPRALFLDVVARCLYMLQQREARGAGPAVREAAPTGPSKL